MNGPLTPVAPEGDTVRCKVKVDFGWNREERYVHWQGKLSVNKGNGFKFIISNSEWSTEYGAKEAFDDHDGQTGYRGWELAQSSNQFYPLLMGFGDGNYRITADLTTMTVRFEAM